MELAQKISGKKCIKAISKFEILKIDKSRGNSST
jgi:hypothetical protein